MISLSTGFQNLDTLLGCLQCSDLIILTVPPSVSGDSLVYIIALHAATTSYHSVVLFSLDTNKYHIVQRFLAMSSGIDLHRLRTRQMNDDERRRAIETARTLSRANIWIDDTAYPSVGELRQRARQVVEGQDVAFVIVDHLHLLWLSTHDKWYEDLFQVVFEVSHSLKVLA